MRVPLSCAIVACLNLTSCVSQPEVFAPPAQRKPLDQNQTLARSIPLLDMGEPLVDHHFVKDILGGEPKSTWRWTNQRPTVKIELMSTTGLKFHIEFAIADATFKDTGPLTLTFFVNDHELDRVRYDAVGTKKFEKPVPAAWLRPMAVNTVAAELDKVWVAGDGVKLGVLLMNIGFVQ